MSIGKMDRIQDKENENLLILLKKAQDEFGYVPEDIIADIAQSLDVSVSEVFGVTTFYSFLSDKPMGKNVIRVCQSLPCYLQNSLMIIKSVEDELGIKPGEVTPDGQFSLELTNCIGACDKAPAMLVNNDIHADLTPEKISQILEEYKDH